MKQNCKSFILICQRNVSSSEILCLGMSATICSTLAGDQVYSPMSNSKAKSDNV
jgi:hypothetical protein